MVNLKDGLSPELTFAVEYLNFSKVTGVPDSTLERHQITFLSMPDDFTIDVKSRQIGWSWGAALWAVCRAVLTPNKSVFFISVNQDEADNKIKLAKIFLAAFDTGSVPNIDKDNTREITFSNGSSIRSEPSAAPRGVSQADIILDEYAFVKRDAEIYQGLIPIVSRGGRIRIGSTPFGARGRFYEVFTDVDSYPNYRRRAVAWWDSDGLCLDTKIAHTVIDQAERVRLFGTKRLVNIFNNTKYDEFMQEYCCSWVSGEFQWVTETEIALAEQWYLLNGDKSDCIVADTQASPDPVADVIAGAEELQSAVLAGRVNPALYVGYDVGRFNHTSDIIVISSELDDSYPVRLTAKLDKIDYDTQLFVLGQLDTILKPVAINIDSTGIGSMLAEQAEARIPSAQGIWFSGDKKADMAFVLKERFQKGNAPVPNEPRLLSHIRAIHRTVTAANRTVFDVYSRGTHHADAFWALALAHYGTVGGTVEEAFDEVRRN